MGKAPKEGPNGVDRWTSNGYGIVSGPVSEAKKRAGAKIAAELAKKAKKSGKKK